MLIVTKRFVAGVCCGKYLEEEKKEEKRVAVATALLVTAAVTTVINGLANFFKNINGPSNVKDVSLKTFIDLIFMFF